jgi:hypothetical protein
MKKLITFVICMMTLSMGTIAYAQTLNLNITQVEEGDHLQYCENLYDSVNVSKDPSCNGAIHWRITYYPGGTATDYYADNVTFPFNNTYEKVMVRYWGCDIDGKWFQIYPLSFENVPEPWTEDIEWIASGETLELYAQYSNTLNYLWPDGSTNCWYDVTGPEMSGKVWVRMYNDCGSLSDTINVYYNSDIAMATVDPQTDHIIVTWEVDPLLAGYLESLTIIRDGYQIATVPYIQGQYVDEAVSGSVTSRTYRCKAIAKDGSVCDFNSAPKPSIHMVYTVGYFGTVEMQFNDVSSNYEDLFQYYISQWSNGEITHVDSIMPGRLRDGESLKTALGYVTMRDGVINYSAPESYFSDGYLIVEADLNGSKNRDVAGKFLSNRSENTVGIHEVEGVETFNIYPNPSSGVFNIETDREMTITVFNLMGQTIAKGKTENGIFTISDLPSGIYFVKSDKGLVQKVVVE